MNSHRHHWTLTIPIYLKLAFCLHKMCRGTSFRMNVSNLFSVICTFVVEWRRFFPPSPGYKLKSIDKKNPVLFSLLPIHWRLSPLFLHFITFSLLVQVSFPMNTHMKLWKFLRFTFCRPNSRSSTWEPSVEFLSRSHAQSSILTFLREIYFCRWIMSCRDTGWLDADDGSISKTFVQRTDFWWDETCF